MNIGKKFSLLIAAIFATFALSSTASIASQCVRIASPESSGEKLSTDPADQLSAHDAAIVYAIYDRFIDLDDSFEPVPALATSWEPSDAGKTWTFKIQEGVKFHDGSDLNAADVVWTFRRLLDPEVGSGAGASILDFLTPEGIQVVNDHTVSFTAKDPVAEMPLLLTTKLNLVVPEGKTGDDLRHNGVGSGPFKLVGSLDPSAPIWKLEANADYWGGPAKAKCLEHSVITEALTLVSALKAGDIDVALSIDPAVLGAVKDDSNINLVETGAGTSQLLAMDVRKPPFDNVKVRQAMKAVVDRQAILNTALLGIGELGNDNPVPPAWPSAYTSEIKQQDIPLAKKLLAEAGYPDGIDVDLFTSDALPGMSKIAQIYQQMAADAGIRVNLQISAASSFWDDIWMQRPFTSSGWSIRPPAVGLSVAYSFEGKWNETYWYDRPFQDLLDKGKTEIDDGKRAQHLKDAQQRLSEHGGTILPVFIHQVAGIRANCEGFKPHAQNFNLDYRELICN